MRHVVSIILGFVTGGVIACLLSLPFILPRIAFAQSPADIGTASFATCKWTSFDDTNAALAKAYAGQKPAVVAAAVCAAVGPPWPASLPRYEAMKRRANPPVINGVPLKGHFGPPYTPIGPVINH